MSRQDERCTRILQLIAEAEDMLAPCPLAVEIGDALGVNRSYAQQLLRRCVNAGYLSYADRAHYRLTDAGRAVAAGKAAIVISHTNGSPLDREERATPRDLAILRIIRAFAKEHDYVPTQTYVAQQLGVADTGIGASFQRLARLGVLATTDQRGVYVLAEAAPIKDAAAHDQDLSALLEHALQALKPFARLGATSLRNQAQSALPILVAKDEITAGDFQRAARVRQAIKFTLEQNKKRRREQRDKDREKLRPYADTD